MKEMTCCIAYSLCARPVRRAPLHWCGRGKGSLSIIRATWASRQLFKNSILKSNIQVSLIEGRLSTASAKDELIKLASRLIVEEALEGEAGDVLGRDYYEHGAQPGQGYRNGYRTGRLKSSS